MDANGDGIGDFHGLMPAPRLSARGSASTRCGWRPSSPRRGCDDGYDITDYYGVDPRFGSLGDFVEFMHAGEQRGMRVIIDLVVNHTSDQHPWFQAARRDPDSPLPRLVRLVGQAAAGLRTTGWCSRACRSRPGRSTDRRARTTSTASTTSSPTSNMATRAVRDEIRRIMGFWLQLGVSGFRMDAVPFVIETQARPATQARRALRLPARVPRVPAVAHGRRHPARPRRTCCPTTDLRLLRRRGDRLHMMFNFCVNQHLFYALATRRRAAARARRCGRRAKLPPTRAVGALPAQPRRARSRPADRRAARGGVRRVRPRSATCSSTTAASAAGSRRCSARPPPHGAGVQPAVLAAGHAGPALRRRDRHGRGPAPAERDASARRCSGRPSRNGGSRRRSAGRARSSTGGPFGYERVNVEDQRRDPGSLLSWTTG